MVFDFRLPYFSGSDREQLAQIRAYLYQLIPQLQWAFSAVGAPQSSASSDTPTAPSIQVMPVYARARTADAWASLGLASDIKASEVTVGRVNGAGCFCRSDGNHVYVAFNCAFVYAGNPVRINLNPIPEGSRPAREVYAICAADGHSFARIRIHPDGIVLIDQLNPESPSAAVEWIDGYIDYWI